MANKLLKQKPDTNGKKRTKSRFNSTVAKVLKLIMKIYLVIMIIGALGAIGSSITGKSDKPVRTTEKTKDVVKTKTMNSIMRSSAESILDQWFEKHPKCLEVEYKAEGRYKIDAQGKRYLSGYYTNIYDKEINFLFEYDKRKMYFEVDYNNEDEYEQFITYINSKYNSLMHVKSVDLINNLDLDETQRDKECNLLVGYIPYDLFVDKRSNIMDLLCDENSNKMFDVVFDLNDDIYTKNMKDIDSFADLAGVHLVTYNNPNTQEKLSISNIGNYYNQIDYSFWISVDLNDRVQVKYPVDISEVCVRESDNNENDEMVNIRKERAEYERNPDSFEVQMNVSFIVIGGKRDYYVYLSNTKFLENQQIYKSDSDYTEIDLIEVNNGKYPYAFANKGETSPSKYNDVTMFVIK